MDGLNYHHLMYFRSIATEGSISRASEKLRIGQPALSAQLKQLEESFGEKLFERKSRRLFLTDAGRAALQYANQIYELGIELSGVVRDKSFSLRPKINMGALDSVPKHLISSLVTAARGFENCHISVVEGEGDFLVRQLVSHSLDLILTNYSPIHTENRTLFTRSLGKMPVAVYAAPKFAHLKKDFPKSLSSQAFILPSVHSKLRHDVEHFFQLNDIYFEIVADTQDTAIQKILCSEGMGLIVEPVFAMKELLNEGKVVQLGVLKAVFEEYFIVSTKRVVEKPIAQELAKNFQFKGA